MQTPCEEIDQLDRLNDSTTTVTRAFYDGEGRLIQPVGPLSKDLALYDPVDKPILCYEQLLYLIALDGIGNIPILR